MKGHTYGQLLKEELGIGFQGLGGVRFGESKGKSKGFQWKRLFENGGSETD